LAASIFEAAGSWGIERIDVGLRYFGADDVAGLEPLGLPSTATLHFSLPTALQFAHLPSSI
jgi:hypothetical protein